MSKKRNSGSYKRNRKIIININKQKFSGVNRCFYCNNLVQSDEENRTNFLTVDHFVPISKGGTNHPSNLVVSCLKCNQIKDDKIFGKELYEYQRKKEKVS